MELAQQLERTAFEAATGDESYYQLLAIQTYKLRKLAKGEIMPPPDPPSIPRVSITDVGNDGGTASTPTNTALLQLPTRLESRLPSLPGIFSTDIDFAEVDFLAWDPQSNQ
jgi:hypothetical protein